MSNHDKHIPPQQGGGFVHTQTKEIVEQIYTVDKDETGSVVRTNIHGRITHRTTKAGGPNGRN